jgi:hypothetical protein
MLTGAEVTALMARTAWFAPTYRFGALGATVFRSADEQRIGSPRSQEIPRAALAAHSDHEIQAWTPRRPLVCSTSMDRISRGG